MSDGRIRVLAVAVPMRDGRVLVEHGGDPTTGSRYYRAIGGGVEFGERAADAVTREWREELDVTLRPGRLLGVLENLFTYRGAPGHEVVFVFEGTVVETAAVAAERFTVTDESGLQHDAEWVPLAALAALAAGGMPLYPDGLAAMVAGAGTGERSPVG